MRKNIPAIVALSARTLEPMSQARSLSLGNAVTARSPTPDWIRGHCDHVSDRGSLLPMRTRAVASYRIRSGMTQERFAHFSIGSDPSFVFTANPVYDIICR